MAITQLFQILKTCPVINSQDQSNGLNKDKNKAYYRRA